MNYPQNPAMNSNMEDQTSFSQIQSPHRIIRPTTQDPIHSGELKAELKERWTKRPSHSKLPTKYSRHGLSTYRPQYSLAGNLGRAHTPSYIDPKYYEFNPAYQKPINAPVWGLAKPLPRVVRHGMKNRSGVDVVEDGSAEIPAPGFSEAIPQVGMIEGQREEAGKESLSSAESDGKLRGYGHHQGVHVGGRSPGERRRTLPVSSSTVSRIPSTLRHADRGTPRDEISDPMNMWKFSGNENENDSYDIRGDLGCRIDESSDMDNAPTRPRIRSRDSIDFRTFQESQDDIDLETGQKGDEWSLNDDEAEDYIREEQNMHNSWASVRARYREPLAEALATMISVLIGLCTNLAVQTSNDKYGSYQSTNWAWGLGVTIGIYIAGGISGGHLNPAISLMLCFYRGFPMKKALVYISAQVLGALLAGLIAYGVYRDAINKFNSAGGSIAAEGGDRSPLGLYTGGSGTSFFTQPGAFTGVGTGFANEFVATAILSCAILALGDDSNAPPGAGMHAFIVGLLVTVLTMAFGYNTGACMNPARDLGPRLATAAVGYGGQVFTARNAWWIYGAWGATISGSLAGGLLYDFAIFVGGESPVNYPRQKRVMAKQHAEEETKRRWKIFKKDLGRRLERDLEP